MLSATEHEESEAESGCHGQQDSEMAPLHLYRILELSDFSFQWKYTLSR